MKRVRNIGVTAHINAGKITTIECILYYTDINYKIGDTHEGTVTMDRMAQEQKRGITVTSATATCHWTLQENCKPKPGALEHRIDITDTPGHVGFTVEAERSPRVLDGAVDVFCAEGGVEPQSGSVWRQADIHNVPRVASINKMDILGVDFYGAMNQTRTRLGKNAVCIQLPIGEEDDFRGITDLFGTRACIYNDDRGNDISIVNIPEDMQDSAELYRSELVEKICKLDDDLMMTYLESEESSNDDLEKALRKTTCECATIPVCYGTVYRNKGVQKLLDAAIEFMPSSLDIPSIKGADLDGNKVECRSSDGESFAALASKIMVDSSVGKLAFFRVYSGSLDSDSYVLSIAKGKRERVGRILQMHANKRNELDRVYSSDIIATVGFKVTSTGDTICNEKNPVILESTEFPEPTIDIAIEPKTRASQGKVGGMLVKLTKEDPASRVHTDEEAGQTIISGMDELHLDIIVGRLFREFDVEAGVGAPQVVYKETLTRAVDAGNEYAKQSDGHGQYGYCKVHFISMEANAEEAFKFTPSVVGGAIPKRCIPVVGEGTEEACRTGILGGFPVPSVHVDVYDGSYHEIDSSGMAFRTAGSMAFKEVMHKGNPILFEPATKVEVTMSEDYMGDVTGDINLHRECIEGMEGTGGDKMVRVYVPLSEMFGYSTDPRSRTQGHGNYSMSFDKCEPVPKNVQEKVLSDCKK